MAWLPLTAILALLSAIPPTTRPVPHSQASEPGEIREVDSAALQKLAVGSRELRLVTVWATWCAPCLAELPECSEISRSFSAQGLKWTTVSIDDLKNQGRAYQVLREKKVFADNCLFTGQTLSDLSKSLDPSDTHWDGSPPHALLIAPGGKIVYRRAGPVDRPELVAKIKEHLNSR